MAEGSTQPPHATRFLETTRGILSYTQLAPLLAEQVLRVLQDIEDGVFAARPLDESLLLGLHRHMCGDLVPDWAGRFRTAEVRVGRHVPPPSHRVPLLVRDYFANLSVRMAELSTGTDALLLETLAFAEGRLLFIHPFEDFNGRVTRLLLAEILRRQELPPVELASVEDVARLTTSARWKPPTSTIGRRWSGCGRNVWKPRDPGLPTRPARRACWPIRRLVPPKPWGLFSTCHEEPRKRPPGERRFHCAGASCVPARGEKTSGGEQPTGAAVGGCQWKPPERPAPARELDGERGGESFSHGGLILVIWLINTSVG